MLRRTPARIDFVPHLAHPRNDHARPLSRPASRPQSPSKHPPPPPPGRYNGRRASYVTSVSDQNPFRHGDHDADHPPPPPLPQVHSKPPMHPDVNPLVSDSTPPVIPYSAYNPFMARSKPEKRPPGQDEFPSKGPPLPPRKPAISQPSMSIKSTPLSTNPFKPPKPTHLVTPLMKHSLEVSRAGVVQRKVEENLNHERVLQVLKSSSIRNRSSSPSKLAPSSSGSSTSGDPLRSDARSERSVPSLPPRRNAQSPHRSAPSVAGSTMSYESVANARLSPSPLSYRARSPFSRSPERGRILAVTLTDEPRPNSLSPTRPMDIAPPPTHPDRKPPPVNTSTVEISSDGASPTYPLSPTSPKVFRSKSMGHPKPLPPPTRKPRARPESMQLPQNEAGATSMSTPPPSTAAVAGSEFPLQKVTRRVSLSSTHSRASSIDSSPSVRKNLQRTLSALQPKLDAARYKVEAGLSKRGFVDHTTNSRPHLISAWGDEGEKNLIGGTDATNMDKDRKSVV